MEIVIDDSDIDTVQSPTTQYEDTQPGGALYGLQLSNLVDPRVASGTVEDEPGSAAQYGTPNDPMNGNFIGGINVFGEDLTLYDENGMLVGAIGVSIDTSYADHNCVLTISAYNL